MSITMLRRWLRLSSTLVWRTTKFRPMRVRSFTSLHGLADGNRRCFAKLAAIEITPEQLVELRVKPGSDQERPVIIDVRESNELKLAELPGADVHHVALSSLYEALENHGGDDQPNLVVEELLPSECKMRSQTIVTLCHHGVRSKAIADLLKELGWTNVHSLYGGIDLYADSIDPTIGRY